MWKLGIMRVTTSFAALAVLALVPSAVRAAEGSAPSGFCGGIRRAEGFGIWVPVSGPRRTACSFGRATARVVRSRAFHNGNRGLSYRHFTIRVRGHRLRCHNYSPPSGETIRCHDRDRLVSIEYGRP